MRAVLHDVHPNQVTEWKRQLVDQAADVFGGQPNAPLVDLKVLHAKIGQLALENDFLENGANQSGIGRRKQIITANHPLPISTHAKLLNISHGTVYYLPKPTSEKDLAIMHQIDEMYLRRNGSTNSKTERPMLQFRTIIVQETVNRPR